MNDFKKEYRYFKLSFRKSIDEVLKSGWYILGDKTEKFESEFAKYVGVKYCLGVGNGMEALQISLMSLNIGKGDEVITVANSAVATALAISNVGAKPIFVDVDDYFHIDPTKLEKKITSKTKAIIPVHLFGQMVDIKEVLKVAKKHNLAAIEDACQSHGASFAGKKAGSFGKLGCFSFYPTKNLGGIGDGGAITTDSKELFEKCKSLRNYGQKNRYQHKVKGLNSRLDELQAAILSAKLRKLDLLIKKRQTIAKVYFRNLAKIPQISLPKIRTGGEHSFHLFVIKAKSRNKLQAFLKKSGIQTLIHYPIPIHKQECYREFKKQTLNNTENLKDEILSLPIHPFMSKGDVLLVCSAIRRFYIEGK